MFQLSWDMGEFWMTLLSIDEYFLNYFTITFIKQINYLKNIKQMKKLYFFKMIFKMS